MVAIFVVLTIAVFLLIDAFIQRRQARRLAVAGASAATAPKLPKVHVARGVFFAPNHLWMRVLPSGLTRMGIDDFTQKLVGRVDSLKTVEPGAEVKQGQPIIWVQQDNRTLTLQTPTTGRVVRVNRDGLRDPEISKGDPYGRGWLIEFEPEALGQVAPHLFIAERAVQWLRREGQRLREFIGETLATHSDVGLTMADGGLPSEGVTAFLGEGAWQECKNRFFSLPETA